MIVLNILFYLKNIINEFLRNNPNALYKDFELVKELMTLTPLEIDFLTYVFYFLPYFI